jgi:hypothetical protein
LQRYDDGSVYIGFGIQRELRLDRTPAFGLVRIEELFGGKVLSRVMFDAAIAKNVCVAILHLASAAGTGGEQE